MNFKQFKQKIRRSDSESNNQLHWFSSKISSYVSYFAFKLGLSADQMTVVFFIFGIASSISFISNSIIYTIVGYLLFRMHIICDMSDGDLARINKSFSIRGVYWDSMAHSIINPLIGITICFSFYSKYEDIIFVILMSILSLTISLTSAIKNNYFKALYFHNFQKNKINILNLNSGFKGKIFFIVSEMLAMEGLILLNLLESFVPISKNNLLILIILYIFGNVIVVLIKWYLNSYKDGSISKV